MIRGCFRPLAVFALVLFFAHHAYAQMEPEVSADVDEYIQLISRLRTLPSDRQVDELKGYLDKHPDSSFRAEIESNISTLNKFLTNTDPTRKKDEKDTDTYFKAVGLSKKLSIDDQIMLWEQFLAENPNTIYKKDILYKLQGLKSKSTPRTSTAPDPSPTMPSNIPIARRLAYKEKDKALLLSIFPGIVVPGMAHWYTRDYVIAGVLTALRVAGLGIGLQGILQRENKPTITGGMLVGFSYMADVVDAPFTVERYNDNLEKTTPPQAGISVGPKAVFVTWLF